MSRQGSVVVVVLTVIREYVSVSLYSIFIIHIQLYLHVSGKYMSVNDYFLKPSVDGVLNGV